MSKKTMYANESPADRQNMLHTGALKTEQKQVRRVYEPEEIEAFKSDHVSAHIALAIVEEQKKEAMNTFKDEIKELKDSAATLRNMVKDGYIDESKQVFLFDNQEEGVMEHYDETGICVYERPLLPAEKQIRISSFVKTA